MKGELVVQQGFPYLYNTHILGYIFPLFYRMEWLDVYFLYLYLCWYVSKKASLCIVLLLAHNLTQILSAVSGLTYFQTDVFDDSDNPE